MTPSTAVPHDGMTLRAAALIAGLGYLLNPVTYAEFALLPSLVIPGNIDQTTQNISAHPGRFVAAVLCYLVSFIGDIVIAWALYHLLAPVNRAVSLLAAWFQLIYTAGGICGLLNLLAVYRLLTTPELNAAFAPAQLHAQVQILLGSFRWDWSFSLTLFGVHLVLIGSLIYRSRYIPRVLGVLLVIDGLAWEVDSLRPYLYPNAHLDYLSIAFLPELVFMLWLLIRGWKIPEPITQT